MITLTKRQRDMLMYLLNHEEYLTYDHCAKVFHVSNRSVRNDMEMISAFLTENDCCLSKKAGVGIRIECNSQQRADLNQKLDQIQNSIFNKEERQDLIIYLLLLKDIVTFQELADCCQVSKQTVINCFSSIQKELEKEQLFVEKTQGVGLSLVGDEAKIRHKFIQMITHQKVVSLNIQDYLCVNCLRNAEIILEAMKEQCGITYVNQKRIHIILSYLLMRIENHHLLNDKIQAVENTSQHVDDILNEYIKDSQEKNYVITILLGERINPIDQEMFIEDDAYKIAMELVKSLSQLNQTTINQLEMIRGLTIHLRSAIYRYHNHIQIHNELLDQIKISISLIYEFTRLKLSEIEGEYDLEFDENEIAYIAMYIASIYETSIKENITLNVLAVCSFGLATSSILKTRIMSILLDCHMLGPMSLAEASDYLEKNKVDMVISTHECSFEEIPVIVVNPLLNQNDIEKIKNRLFQLSYSKMCQQFILESSKAKLMVHPHYIADYVKKENIQIKDRCDNWEQAIQLAAKPLLETGKIHQSYVDCMIHAVKDFGTYMVLTPKTAYVHAGVNDGIIENCTSMLVLKHDLAFGYQNAKLVRNIVVLGIKNKDENDLLNLVYILEKEENIRMLEQENVHEEMILKIHD